MEMKAIVLRQYGGPEELRLDATEIAAPAAGELLVRHSAIGVNFHDCYVRSGLYKTLALPGIPGIEAVGIVEAIGPGVSGFAVGNRVGWVSGRYGGYATHRILPATEAIALPQGIDDTGLAASLMKALTVSVLVTRAHAVKPGETVLVHAAAGGVGQLLSSWCRHLGATVIGTVGSRDKAAVAERAGAHHTILYREENFVDRVKALTGGQGVAAAFDAVGKDTFQGSMDCLGYEGTLVNYGQASGPVDAFTPSALAVRSLSEAAQAHEVLEAQRSPGGVVLVP
jgi:NADPH2:quinone reductase